MRNLNNLCLLHFVEYAIFMCSGEIFLIGYSEKILPFIIFGKVQGL